MSSPPASWHPDPTGRHQLRYWNGSVWTDHVFTRGVQGSDLLLPGLQPSNAASAKDSTPDAGAESSAGTSDAVVIRDPTAGDAPRKPGMFARMRQERQAKSAGREEFEQLAMRAGLGDEDALSALPAAVADARALYRVKQLEEKLWATMATAIRNVIADDILSADEEQHLHRLGEVLGTPLPAIQHRDRPLFEELVIAGINDGRFPNLSSPRMILKRGEDAYASFGASLMKEQAVRQFQAGTSSVSIPLGGGVRYRVGGVRGRSVVVGSELVVQDSGELFVTSQRVLYTGRGKTLEFRNDRLVGLEQFTDGLRLSVSNRQTASLFKLDSPSIAAALISASAAQSN